MSDETHRRGGMVDNAEMMEMHDRGLSSWYCGPDGMVREVKPDGWTMYWEWPCDLDVGHETTTAEGATDSAENDDDGG